MLYSRAELPKILCYIAELPKILCYIAGPNILCYSKVESEAARNSLLSEHSSHISTFPQTSSVLPLNLIFICEEHKYFEYICISRFSQYNILLHFLGSKLHNVNLTWPAWEVSDEILILWVLGKVEKMSRNVKDVSLNICWNIQTTQASFAAEFLGHTFIQTDKILCQTLIWHFPPFADCVKLKAHFCNLSDFLKMDIGQIFASYVCLVSVCFLLLLLVLVSFHFNFLVIFLGA